MADAAEPHLVWWDGTSWFCSCGDQYLVTDLDAERHYHVTHGKPISDDRA